MTGAPPERKQKENPLVSTLVGWGFGAPTKQSLDEGDPAETQPNVADWEQLLRQQNAANDEICSENGRLRAELERLRADEEDDARVGQPEDELLVKVLGSVETVLSDWSASCTTGVIPKALRETEDDEDDDEDEDEEDDENEVDMPETTSADVGVEDGKAQEWRHEFEDTDHGGETMKDKLKASGSDESGASKLLEIPAAGEDVIDEDARAGERRHKFEDTGHGAETVNDKPNTGDSVELGASNPPEVSDAREDGELHGGGKIACGESGDDASSAYCSAVSAAVCAAVRAAFEEDAQSSSPSPMYSPAEETAVLVGEKIALRETVEQQQELIDALEMELADAGAPPLANVLLTNALTAAGRGFSDAGGALSAGLSMLSRPETKPKDVVARPATVTVGHEYEVVGLRGAIVRRNEALKSDLVTELPPGSRVRIVAVSERNHRRVEIVSVRPGMGSSSETAHSDQVDAEIVLPSSVPNSPHGNADMASPRLDVTTISPTTVTDDSGYLGTTADALAEVPIDGKDEAAVGNSGDVSVQVSPGLSATAPAKELVKGWISASTKDGRLLIRPAPLDGGEIPGAADPDGREEGREEIASVTLSIEEWQLLHQDQEACLQRVSELSEELHGLGSELLQSFEMKTVSGELALAVERAQARCNRESEATGMAAAELEQLWAAVRLNWQWVEAPRAGDVPGGPRNVDASESSCPDLDSEFQGVDVAARGGAARRSPAGSALSGGARAGCDNVDWDRIVSERETTSAALSAALSRVATLDREHKELERERAELEGRRKGEVGSLRAALRRLARPAVSAMAGRLPGLHVAAPSPAVVKDGSGASSGAASSAAEGLFKHRLADLQKTVTELQTEVSRASASEAALRRSVEARRVALRRVLHRGATADLMNLQCGPFTMPGSADAERHALRSAVEEQLRFNMHLSTSLPTSGTKREIELAKPD